MTKKTPLRLFEAVGVELEYMIVDSNTLSVKPVADEVLKEAAGSVEYISDYEQGDIDWSNELVLHVIELKTSGPVTSLVEAAGLFQRDIRRINHALRKHGARLMPTGAHPWMNPADEAVLWPHERREIYETYDRIFNCKRLGWANLQSSHVNLPFGGDAEFGRLSAAVRLLLPIIPAISASTPIVAMTRGTGLDSRLDAYMTNSLKIPSLAGEIIPEPLFRRKDYERFILQKMYEDVAPHDPEKILRHEWLNSRGAIARFDRDALEIRVIDMQEAPVADLAIASLVFNTSRMIADELWLDYEFQKSWNSGALKKIFTDVTRGAENTIIQNKNYLEAFGMKTKSGASAGDLWRWILEEMQKAYPLEEELRAPVDVIMTQGSLATRILKSLGDEISPEGVRKVYSSLCDCLDNGVMFTLKGNS